MEQEQQLLKDIIMGKNRMQKKKIGQFFTPITVANYMASLFCLNNKNSKLSILDAGAGEGVLTEALVNRIVNERSAPQEILATLYETDQEVLPHLLQKVETLTRYVGDKNCSFKADVKTADFLQSPDTPRYDLAIMNPPYKKAAKNAVMGIGLDNVIEGQPNYYFLFIEKMLRVLHKNGEFVVICPRSWTSGLYFRLFRKSLFSLANLQDVYVFTQRNDVFGNESVLQETVILHGTKSKQESTLCLHAGSGGDFNDSWSVVLPFDRLLVNDDNSYILLPTNDQELNAVRCVARFTKTLSQQGYILKTGPVVEFRNRQYLSYCAGGDTIPLLRPGHIRNGSVSFPTIDNRKPQYLMETAPKGVLTKNQNMILFKRFTSKEEKRRLQVAIYHRSIFEKYEYIAIENHVTYLVRKDRNELTDKELIWLYSIFSSDVYDNYYRALNGSTQVNSSEINNMPVPNTEDFEGMRLEMRNQSHV